MSAQNLRAASEWSTPTCLRCRACARFDRALLCRGAIDYMNMLNGGAAQEVQLTAPTKRWQPPGGYDPKSRSASAASPAPVAGAPAIESVPVSAPEPAKMSTPAVQASAVSKTVPAEQLRALAEKWGYDPKDKSGSAASPAASARRPVTKPEPAPARASSLAQTQPSAPSSAREPSAAELRALAEKWGYEASALSKSTSASASSPAPAASAPKPTPAPAPASAPAPEPEVSSATVASAERKWQPPGGYDPKSRSANAGGWGLADADILRYIIYLILFINIP